jgi:ATP-dependent DNA helicase RecG
MKNSKKLSISQFNPLEKISTPAVIAKLNRLGISRPEDLLVFFPIRYEDETQIFEIMGAPERESVQIEVTVIQAKVEFRPRRQLVVTVEDCSGRAILRFLHFYPSQQRALEPGSRIRALGELRIGR